MREESRLLDYLEHILQAVERIQDYTEDTYWYEGWAKSEEFETSQGNVDTTPCLPMPLKSKS